MAKKEETKVEKSTVLGGAIFIIIIVGLIFMFSKGYFNESKILDKEERINKITEIHGLYDSVQVGGLTFTLESIQLDFYNRSRFNLPSSYWLFFKFNIINNGENIENVSDCGVLQFEDGSQYNTKLSDGLTDITDSCEYFELYPGSQMIMTPYFTFIEPFVGKEPYIKEKKDWKEVPGSKIIYFSKQNNKLIKYSIDKIEIIYMEDYF